MDGFGSGDDVEGGKTRVSGVHSTSGTTHVIYAEIHEVANSRAGCDACTRN
jgi:hypothetical protein